MSCKYGGNCQKLCSIDKCKICEKKSFMSSNRVECWSDKNEKKPRQVFISTATKYYFNCKECSHEIFVSPNNIKRGHWCKYCSQFSGKMCSDKSCKVCEAKSFQSSDKAKYWSKKNKLTPRDVMKTAAQKYYFDCDKCKHTFKITLSHIREGKWCNICSGHKICYKDNCEKCFSNSFASHAYSIHWSKKNEVTPRKIRRCCNDKYVFKCPDCKLRFKCSPANISLGRRCSHCKNKTEKKLHLWLVENFGENNVGAQQKFKWSINKDTNKNYSYDFRIKGKKMLIELDGDQHFRDVWKESKYIREKDVEKMQFALQNGYSLVRIYQMDVYNDHENWKDKLIKEIYKREKPEIIFIETKNVDYSIYKLN